MPTAESSSTVKLSNRGLDLQKIEGPLPRPIEMKNTGFDMVLEIEKETTIRNKDDNVFQGVLEKPTRLSYRYVPTLPTGYERLFAGVLGAINVDEEKINVNFDKAVTLILPTLAEKEGASLENITVLYYDEESKNYVLANGNGGELSEDGESITITTTKTGKYIVVNTNGLSFSSLNNLHSSAGYGNTPFSDISEHWAKNYISRLYEMNIVKGRSANQFVPDENVTRAELTKIALNTFGYKIPETVDKKPFNDVEVTDWYAPYVQTAKETGVLEGYADGTFHPNQAINRAETLKILLKAAQLSVSNYEANFEDVDNNAWFAKYVAYAKAKEIVSGYQVASNNETKVSDLYFFSRYLGEGDTGEDVGNLQRALQSLGFYSGEINNVFDTQTSKALSQYQISKGLAAAGSFGPQTKVAFANEQIASGETSLFKPGQSVTRAETAKIALKTYDLKSLVINDEVSQILDNVKESLVGATKLFVN